MGEAKCTLARDVQPGGWSYVCGGGGLNVHFLIFLVEGLREVLYRYSHGGEGSEEGE